MAENIDDMAKRFQDMTLIQDTLIMQLECPVCLETCIPPIFMCINGHNICSNCQKQIQNCPTCRAVKPTNRNIFAEATSAHLGGPCWYRDFGCKGFIIKSELNNHVKNCDFRYECVDCGDYHGDFEGLHRHVLTCSFVEYRLGEVLKDKIKNGRKSVVYQSCFGSLIRFEIIHKHTLCVTAKNIGPIREPGKYAFWIELVSEDGYFQCTYRFRYCSEDQVYRVVVETAVTKMLKDATASLHVTIKIKEANKQ